MKMLLRNVTIEELADIFARNQDRSPAPYLTDPAAIRRARSLARKNGIWNDISQNLDPSKDIPVIKRSVFRNYQRVGDRQLPQARDAERLRELLRAAHALWLGHPKADIDYLQDLLWAYCDSYTWVRAAHEGRSIDLGSGKLATAFSEILYVLGDHLEAEVKTRLTAEIDRRIFQNFWNYRHLDAWKTVRMNWNHVCNGAVIRTALYQIEDPRLLALMTHGAIQNLTYALDGFSDDGGCEEGPGYWGFGFGHYLYVALALYHKTNGELDLMDDPKIERICRYPLAAHISGAYRSTFADAGHGNIPSRVAITINAFLKIPELYSLCPQHSDRTLRLQCEDHGLAHDLALYRGNKATTKQDNADYVLPDLGQVKIRGRSGKDQLTLMAIAGHNGVPHNHNDIGSFIVHRGDHLHLVDPGGPLYTARTFGPQRYDIVYCSSYGHSVPVINGRRQKEGKQHHGALATRNLNGQGEKRIDIDMTHAYPRGTVKKLIRTFGLDVAANRLHLEDAYTFSRCPKSVEEAFVTFEKATVAQDGQSVQIGPRSKGICLSAPETPGTFSVAWLEEESKRDGKGDRVITRIAFRPDTLAKEMILRFDIG